MKRLLWLLLLCALLLSGCMSRQLEEQLLVILMGVDRAEDGNLVLTVENPMNTLVRGTAALSCSLQSCRPVWDRAAFLAVFLIFSVFDQPDSFKP